VRILSANTQCQEVMPQTRREFRDVASHPVWEDSDWVAMQL